MIIEFIKALIYGIVEGITEWLPISSTGHLILLGEWLPLNISENPEFQRQYLEMFNIVIQLGAIIAIIIMFWNKLWPFNLKNKRDDIIRCFVLWFKIIAASIPAAIVGFGVDAIVEKATGKTIDGWLYNAYVVAAMLIVYGILFIIVEKINRNKPPRINNIYDISYKDAFFIGCFQSLSIIPGTSRSGSTILGSIAMGISRTATAEFCFIMAIPVMVGKSGLKMLKYILYLSDSGISAPTESWIVLAIGFAVSFIVSIIAVKFLMEYVKKHSFTAFGIYRIVLGIAVLLQFAIAR